MSKNKFRPPAQTERDRLLEALFGPDEELDSQTAHEIVRAHGIAPSELISRFASRLEDEARELRLRGIPVPPAMQNALQNLRAGTALHPELVCDDPIAWLDGLLAGTLQSSQQRSTYSLRPRKPGERLTGNDQNILDKLSTEIEEEEKDK